MRLHHINHMVDGAWAWMGGTLQMLASLGLWLPCFPLRGKRVPASGELSCGALSHRREEAGWVWSQGLQLCECCLCLQTASSPWASTWRGWREGWTPPGGDVLPARDSPGIFKHRLQKSFWFVGASWSSLRENNPLFFFFSLPRLL